VTPDAIFAEPRLARLYDALNPVENDQLALLELVGGAPLRILDLGCGTGRLARMLADRGHAVTGVDPASAMLDLARMHDPAGLVRWVEGDALELDLGDDRFDLIVMTGNVFQVFLTDDDARAVLSGCHTHLAPGGRLTFESREPSSGEWETWTPDATREIVTVDGVGDVEVSYAFLERRGDLITFETRHELPDGTRFASPSTLRLRSREELAALLRETGFDRVEWFADWRGTTFGPGALEIVPIATV
jgi:SAM-dependent methyltransferase